MHTYQITLQHQVLLDSALCDADQDFDAAYRPELDCRNFGQPNPLTPDQKIAIGNILEVLRHV